MFDDNNNLNPDFEDSDITMYIWNIEGFEPWDKPLKDFSNKNLKGKEKEKYDKYKKLQQSVLKLEQQIINKLSQTEGVKCLNKAIKKNLSEVSLPKGHKVVFEEVFEIVKIERLVTF